MLKTMWSFLSLCSARTWMMVLSALLLASICLSQESSTPWRQSELIEPSALAKALDSKNPPQVLCVAFPVLYHGRHIPHAIFAGPGSKPEGLALLKAAASALPKDENIVIYCGCCPMEKCPNIRPAYALLKELGFTHVRVLDVPINMHSDWFSKGYPAETGDKQQ
jgi:thiosulfate/3-mercaptopyruvate sulfurtransferase